jgi:predicted N-formylglutamate amidohydrolase
MSAGRHLLRRIELLITCEHGGNRVPSRYRAVFAGAKAALQSHRGYDPGALDMARLFARKLNAPLVFSTTSRLLVELNRSSHHARLFSEYSRRLPPGVRDEVLRKYYEPYRKTVEAHVRAAVRRGRKVVHVSSHSFTPRLRGVVRSADVGLLFDPRRAGESALCRQWQRALQEADASLRVRRNYPYRGSADGFTTYLRTRFPERAYLGIELEVNQRFARGDPRWRELQRILVQSLAAAIADL